MNKKILCSLLVLSFAVGGTHVEALSTNSTIVELQQADLNTLVENVEQQKEEVRRENYIPTVSIMKDIINAEGLLLQAGVLKEKEVPVKEDPEEKELDSSSGLPVDTEWNGDEDDVAWEATFSCTAYCNCYKCCGKYSPEVGGKGTTFSGKMPKEGRTIAVDRNLIPIGTKVVINGHVYTAEDTGSAVVGHVIDIYFADHSATNEWGRRNLKVKVLKK